ncbi:cation diffusion facilitator family transporter [Roseivirga echinicomitans]
MGHDHHHHHHGTGNLRVAFFLNLFFTIVEIIGGIYTGSLAILSDALHDLGDSLSIGLSWYFQKVSEKGRDKKFSYGYKRFSLLGAVINSVILLVGSGIILSKAIPALFNPAAVDAKGMMYFAIFGVIVNGAAVLKLRKGTSINEEVISLHLMEDVLGWVAVLIGSVVMMFWDLPIIDPILSLLIAVYIIYNAYKSLKKSTLIILQAKPSKVDIERIHNSLLSIPEITDVHDCHVWSMDGEYNVLSAHLVIEEEISMDEMASIKSKAKALLKEEHIDHATFEFEGKGEHCEGC